MHFRKKVIVTFSAVKSCGKKSLCKLAKLTNYSKSSVHRQMKTIENRSHISGSQFFETEEGMQWLRRLVLASVLIFGLHGNIGAGVMSSFFEAINIIAFIGLSESSVSRLKHKMMEMLQVYQSELQPALNQSALNLNIVTGADETFFERQMILLFMELSSGYILLEEAATNRKASTWDKLTVTARQKFKSVLCLASDRAKSIIKFTKEAKIKSITDLFHMQQSVVKLFRYAFASKLKTLNKSHKKAEDELSTLIKLDEKPELIAKQEKAIKAIEHQKNTINIGQTRYREQLKAISINTHPFDAHSNAKTAEVLSEQLNNSLHELRSIAKDCSISDGKKRLNYFENHIPDMVRLIALWWQWVEIDLKRQSCSAELIIWLKTRLLPMLYWKQQIKKSRANQSLRDYYKNLYAQAEKNLRNDPLTDKYLSDRWTSWAKDFVMKFQRSTSQIEGHNAILSERNHCLRGMSALHIKTDVVLNNHWIKRDDGKTATERLFKFKPPDLLQWLDDNMPELALPRKRRKNLKEFSPLLSTALAA